MENRVQRYYRIAGVGYRISLPEQCVYPTDGILAPYRVEELEPARTVDFSVVDVLTPPSGTLMHQDAYHSYYRDGDGVICYEGSCLQPHMRLLRQGDHTHVQVLGTAIPYGIVRVGDGYGTVTELLNATSVTKLIRKDPNDLTQAAKYYIDMLKCIHAIEAEDGEFPDMKEIALEWADFVSAHIPQEQGKKLRALIEAVPKRNTMMHGDYHTNNIMLQNGEPLLIDMDTLCVGHPVFELGFRRKICPKFCL